MSKDSSKTPERLGLVVTNLIKLGGLAVGVSEVFTHEHLRPGALGLAALMMAGAQSLETFFGGLFGTTPGKKE